MQKKFTKKRKNLTAVHVVENEQHNNTLCGFISKNVEEGVLLHAQNGRSFSCRTPAASAPLDIIGHNANYVGLFSIRPAPTVRASGGAPCRRS